MDQGPQKEVEPVLLVHELSGIVTTYMVHQYTSCTSREIRLIRGAQEHARADIWPNERLALSTCPRGPGTSFNKVPRKFDQACTRLAEEWSEPSIRIYNGFAMLLCH